MMAIAVTLVPQNGKEMVAEAETMLMLLALGRSLVLASRSAECGRLDVRMQRTM